MMTFEWNALRVGDCVRVHRNGSPLEMGVVAFVDALRGSNGVGIRLTSADGAQEVSWPSRLAVHSEHGDTDDPGSPCVHCAANPVRGVS